MISEALHDLPFSHWNQLMTNKDFENQINKI
jgi:hypothetical protein